MGLDDYTFSVLILISTKEDSVTGKKFDFYKMCKNEAKNGLK